MVNLFIYIYIKKDCQFSTTMKNQKELYCQVCLHM